MKKCKSQCIICPYIQKSKIVRGKDFIWRIDSDVSCQSSNIVYILVYTKENCKQKTKYENRYIGETERSLKNRISEHIEYINSKKYSEPAGEHFNHPGHQISDMRVLILEKVQSFDPQYRKEQESYLIRNSIHSTRV